MGNETISQRTRFRGVEFWSMLALVAIGELVGIGGFLAASRWNPELAKIFAAGAATLFFGSLLGGVVSLLISDMDRGRFVRAAKVEFITNVLADLKNVYDRVDRGRTLIQAHKSAKTYGEEMRGFIAARVKLRTVMRALRFDERGRAIVPISDQVEKMEGYLASLIEEFEDKYKDVSRAQSIYEAKLKAALDRAPQTGAQEAQAPPPSGAPGTPAFAEVLPDNNPWKIIANLPSLRGFITRVNNSAECRPQTARIYSEEFIAPLDLASELLRSALDAQYK